MIHRRPDATGGILADEGKTSLQRVSKITSPKDLSLGMRVGGARLLLRVRLLGSTGRTRMEEGAMISKPAPAYDNAMHAVWRDVRVAALLAAVAYLLTVLPV